MSNPIHIYHGSVDIIENPFWGGGKPYNDYGRGFYCTEHIELAKEWACSSGNVARRRGKAQIQGIGCSARCRRRGVRHRYYQKQLEK